MIQPMITILNFIRTNKSQLAKYLNKVFAIDKTSQFILNIIHLMHVYFCKIQ